MNHISRFSKSWWVLPALLSLVLVFALGCSASSQPAQSSALASGSQPSAQMGNQVGNQVIPFTLRLADGSLVTSAELASQNRPTFMLFFKVP